MKTYLPTISFLFFLLSSLCNISLATEKYFCDSKLLDSLPIQQNGRIKPLLVHAKEILKDLTGKTSQDDLSSSELFCLLSLKSSSLPITTSLKAKIEHVEARILLSVGRDESSVEYDNLLTQLPTIQRSAMLIQKENSYKKYLNKLYNQANIYQELVAGANWLLPQRSSSNEIKWSTLKNFFSEEDLTQPSLASQKLAQAQKDFIALQGDHYLIEVTYAKLHLVDFSMLLTMIALIALVAIKNFNFALGFSVLTVLTESTYMILRMIISGRAPVTNMYETMLFSGLGGLFLALIIGHVKKDKIIVLVGLAYNLLSLFMITFAHGMFSSSIGPLVPVLRDNFWLSTHVTSIILSYGALGLSWLLANVILIKRRFFTLSSDDLARYTDITYTCLKFGTVLLALGIILGGIWADYSWGRFWGWDPKETWSLIVLLIYMAIIHGKHTTWIPPARFIPFTAAAFMSVMMAWFGVNYILASGLHSYGFSEGGALFLFSFFTLQIVLLIVTAISPKEKN
ncbi:MAG: hypothetical protein A2504_08325 [Bdellovibrionales bacterium RIFOXYD12_FULL_39_22]|nr:MAG: hypothetical protein A2385_01550 [Bdellovibrionales bacterium RIFOXYB1_FULL_39_21]OFZ42870.1 MAG: hypothetical protein A2485_10820 [Bdellovibrionales bacterium RIFOXYC12_FULL_39_17]OFZ47470.1 MAG: hypothetical protein A2404_14470 [Bdellovibrionales bacterium RIFOXYC1_FULL_39_130]OFZ71619.1 MAG: hypothetical protein A2451_13245 [Bdellovibrionales bacterium RIFOXYC2_FULL_39_8]OFZ75558.1 MAG: hypothetical protein A2560_14620 [Bdellovibrionales bacterium RIFOXYD1_FULL_39_84]OFZ93881.1 MAG: